MTTQHELFVESMTCSQVDMQKMIPIAKMSEAQRRVMKWLGKGWQAQPGNGSALMVNGQRICNIDTMTALGRAGMVQQDDKRCWSATEAGRSITGRLGL
jgi:hypothetical protein